MNQNQIVVTRGDSREFTVTLTDDQGEAFDLTDVEIAFSVCDLIDKTLGDGITVADPTSGTAVVAISPEDTEGSSWRRSYRYDVQIILSDGKVRTPIRGLFVVIPDVTAN